MVNKTVSEQGLGLITAIHVSIFKTFFNELKHQSERQKSESGAKDYDEKDDDLLEEIYSIIDKPEILWPEMIRLILK